MYLYGYIVIYTLVYGWAHARVPVCSLPTVYRPVHLDISQLIRSYIPHTTSYTYTLTHITCTITMTPLCTGQIIIIYRN